MKFKIKKELIGGRYFVTAQVTEYSEHDQEKALIFGEPSLVIKYKDGRDMNRKISSLSIEPFGFYTQEEADQYVEKLKSQITELKIKWETLKDNWSNEEVI